MSINKDKDATNKYKEAMQKIMEKLGVSKKWSDKHVDILYQQRGILFYEDKPKEIKK